MELYFDNAAAAKVSSDTLDRFRELAAGHFTNQEALVSPDSEHVRKAGEKILKLLCGRAAAEYGIAFANSGTEAVNTAIAAMTWKKNPQIVSTGAEHACVRAALARTGGKITILPHARHGQADFSGIPAETALLATHSVQPETGAVQDLLQIRKILDKSAPGTKLFLDTIQSIGKMPLDAAAIRPDAFTVSGQKLGLPGGAAVIYRKNPVFTQLRTQEHLHGRVPPAFILLMAEHLEKLYGEMTENLQKVSALKRQFFDELEHLAPGTFRRTLPEEISSPYIAHLLLDGSAGEVQGAIIVRALAPQGIIAASGSACDSETKEPSPALSWMGIPRKKAFCGLRISFSPLNDAEGVSRLARALTDAIRDY